MHYVRRKSRQNPKLHQAQGHWAGSGQDQRQGPLFGQIWVRRQHPRVRPATRRVQSGSRDISIIELAAAYWKYQKAYHGWGKNVGDYYCLRDALRVVKQFYGDTPASEFGPLRLKACRQKMLELDWSRKYINRQIDRIRRMFKWGASEEMLPASIHDQLTKVEGLEKGKTTARETKRIKPSLVGPGMGICGIPPSWACGPASWQAALLENVSNPPTRACQLANPSSAAASAIWAKTTSACRRTAMSFN